MRWAGLVFTLVSLGLVVLSPGSWSEVWIETSQADFRDGQAEGGLGANLYASFLGDVRMVDNSWDLNRDGYLDIVFSNECNDSTYRVQSYIYWGSAGGYNLADLDTLPTKGAWGNSIADLDGDGYLDLVFSNHYDDSSYNIWSYIYWGSGSGYSLTELDSLPTHDAAANSVADLNNDGYLDLVFSNHNNDLTFSIHSYIYWGSASGYDPAHLDSLPTHGAHGNCVADLNNDGWLDLVFANLSSDATRNIHSYIYWGSAIGYSGANLDSLPTHGASDNCAADLDSDGYLDLVFSNYYNDVSSNIHSYIYWGSPSGYSATDIDSLPTHGAIGNSVADLDRDGYLDLVFSDHLDSSFSVHSYVYWGSAAGYSPDSLDSLPTHGATGNLVADLNGDGYLDLVFANRRNDESYSTYSYIYWGSSSGYSPTNLDSLPTLGASLGTTKDLGNIYSRDSVEAYLSSVFDPQQTAAWGNVYWLAQVPSGSSLLMELKTGDTPDPDSTWSEWVEIGWGGNIPDTLDSRYIQYRTLMGTNYEATPVLEEVAVNYLTIPQVTVVTPNGGENWVIGNVDTVRWFAYDVSGIDSINIYYSTNGGATWNTISTGEANDFSYAWIVPPTPSESCLVRILAYDPGLVSGEDVSDSLFSISDQDSPQVTVVVPNGGEYWAIGDTVKIEWVATDSIGVDSVNIHYSTDGGFSWEPISTGEPNDSTYDWEVPPPPSPHCLVKIEAFDAALNIGFDESDSLFTIYAPSVEELIAGELRLPKVYSLSQSYPNPFTHSTTIPYTLPDARYQPSPRAQAEGMPDARRRTQDARHITLCIHDLSGRLVRTLVDGAKEPGYHTVRWDGTDESGENAANGVYFVRLSAKKHGGCAAGGELREEGGAEGGEFISTRKLTLLR